MDRSPGQPRISFSTSRLPGYNLPLDLLMLAQCEYRDKNDGRGKPSAWQAYKQVRLLWREPIHDADENP
jgi:hypothetical protein